MLLDMRAARWMRTRKKQTRVTCITLVIAVSDVQYNDNPPPVRGREGKMNELVARLVAKVGVDQTAAEKSVAIILDFLRKEGPADKVQALIDRLPGAEALLQAQQGANAGGGMFSMGG